MEESRDRFLGMVVHGHTLEARLGRGALTSVYRARAAAGGLPLLVTFLVLPATLSSQAAWQFHERFWQLAARLETLRHPNLLPIYGYGERHGQCYLLTPELPGIPLQAARPRHRGWSLEEALQVLAPLASAFASLHQHGLTAQFFHPASLLLLEGYPDLASSLQWTHYGLMQLVRCLEPPEEPLPFPQATYPHLQSLTGHYLGAPDYLAPEVVQGQEATARSDVYTLGILLFTLLSGRPPFTGQSYLQIARHHLTAPLPSLHALVPSLPIALEEVINQALSRDPAQRFSHPQAFVEAYTRCLRQRVSFPPPSLPDPPTSQSPRAGTAALPLTRANQRTAARRHALLLVVSADRAAPRHRPGHHGTAPARRDGSHLAAWHHFDPGPSRRDASARHHRPASPGHPTTPRAASGSCPWL